MSYHEENDHKNVREGIGITVDSDNADDASLSSAQSAPPSTDLPACDDWIASPTNTSLTSHLHERVSSNDDEICCEEILVPRRKLQHESTLVITSSINHREEQEQKWREVVAQKKGFNPSPACNAAFASETPRWVDSRSDSAWESEELVDVALQDSLETELVGPIKVGVVWNRESEHRIVGSCRIPACGWRIEKVFDRNAHMWYVRVGQTAHSNHPTNQERKHHPKQQDQNELEEKSANTVRVPELSSSSLLPPEGDTVPPMSALDEQQSLVRPGAFRVFPPGRSESRNEEEDEEGVMPTSPPGCVQLVGEADLVTFQTATPLDEAMEVPTHYAASNDEPAKLSWRTRKFALMAVLTIAIVIGISLGVTVVSKANPTRVDQAPSPNIDSPWRPATVPPSISPTAQPNITAIVGNFHDSLPNQTIDALLNVSSPQYKAYEWVMLNKEAAVYYGNDPVVRMTQRFALATLYFATGGDVDWKKSVGWVNESSHECSWLGCSCTAENTIQKLDLSENGISGTLPREIGLLREIESLMVPMNRLEGSIPTELAMLNNLDQLQLQNNAFSGIIPTIMGLMTSLALVYLSTNQLTGSIPTELGQLKKLRILHVYGNMLNGSVPTELCDGVSNGLDFIIDCDAVDCDCGCECF